jgi:signal transduction histidine kinase
MKPRLQHSVSIFLGLSFIAILVSLNQSEMFSSVPNLVLMLTFTVLIALTSGFGIPLGGGEVSIMPLIALTGALVMGILPAAWAVTFGDILWGIARGHFSELTGWPADQRGLPLLGTTAANVTMHGSSVLVAGWIYLKFNGKVPIESIHHLFVLIAAAIGFIVTNYVIASLFIGMRGKVHLIYLWKHFPRLLIYEVTPLIFVPLSAQVFLNQGYSQYILLAISVMIISFVLRDQAKSHQHLERRIRELDSLQAVGQALSASLDIDTITEAIYTEVAKLMPTSNFYVALYNHKTNEVSFPIVFEHNQRKTWPPRSTANGMTEYVLNTRKPLLIQKDIKKTIESLGIESRGEQALSWLGVPILAGERALGMIAVQAYRTTDQIQQNFDNSHKEVLITIAAQASVAIQNAQLYNQTDQALALRVQELSSILSTAHEGILLLDTDLAVVEANPALSEILDQPYSEILLHQIGEGDFAKNLGFQADQAVEIFEEIIAQRLDDYRSKVTLKSKPENIYERVISPVLGEDKSIAGWLLVFHDQTEEIRLAQLQEDLTRMLVHDLRSPMVTIQGGLDMIELLVESGEDKDELLEMLEISRRGGQQMLGMINELLSIQKYESGQLVLHYEPVSLPDLVSEVGKGFSSIINHNNQNLSYQISPNLETAFLDRDLIRRTIHNLIDNAIKFTSDGGTIEIEVKPDQENQDQIMLTVNDNGSGIPKEIQSQVFQKYFNSGNQKSRRKGTGIGLYFCKLAVQAHGGSIDVISEPGKGSTFSIRLPMYPDETN